jgi:hypothetical protein
MANEDNFIVAICRRGEKLLLDDFLEIPDHALNGAGQTHLFYSKYNEINMLGAGWLCAKESAGLECGRVADVWS